MKRNSILAVLLVLSAAPLARAWSGFSWDAWREVTGAARPEATSPQAGHEALLPLLETDFDAPERIGGADAWEAKRARVLAVLGAFLGEPEPMRPPAPSAEELGREQLDGYTRVHLRVASETDDAIPAYLLLPDDLNGPAPVMIVLHQTQAAGKQEPCGMSGSADMAFAVELARRGFLCLVPDAIGFGERIPPGGACYDGALDFYRKHPGWSFFGKMNWDVSRLVDYIETLPGADPARIGVIGHSHGAYGAIMAGAFEPRIALVVASCGFNILRTDPSPHRWSHLTALLPRLGFYIDDVNEIPFDWHEIVACIAPRPCFIWATLEDSIFPNTENLAWVYDQARAVYALYGRERAFHGELAPGPHRFPAEAREAVYAWVAEQFKRETG